MHQAGRHSWQPNDAHLMLRGIKVSMFAVQVVMVDVRQIPTHLLPCMTSQYLLLSIALVSFAAKDSQGNVSGMLPPLSGSTIVSNVLAFRPPTVTLRLPHAKQHLYALAYCHASNHMLAHVAQ